LNPELIFNLFTIVFVVSIFVMLVYMISIANKHILLSLLISDFYVLLQLGEWNCVYFMCRAGAGSYIMFALKVSPVRM
jgi:hypothetical protein